jgi:trk system potassium uptake protein
MSQPLLSTVNSSDSLAYRTTLYPRVDRWVAVFESLCALLGLAAVLLQYGNIQTTSRATWILTLLVSLVMVFPALTFPIRYVWSRQRKSFARQNFAAPLLSAIWLIGIISFGWHDGFIQLDPDGLYRPDHEEILWTESMGLLRGVIEIIRLILSAAEAGLNPALVFVLSFMALIGTGALLLMLPRCRPDDMAAAPWTVALFTSTSASCVTGLVVVDTGTYWSRTGQWVILGLIQAGGLGIMTFGASLAAMAGRLDLRGAATFQDILESNTLADVRSLVVSIIGWTFAIELVGAVVTSGLWADLPWADRVFYSLFHSVSAFCNAGFALRAEGLVGWELRGEVFAGFALLIILGGLGFQPMENVRRFAIASLETWRGKPGSSIRLTVSTKVVLVTTAALLVGGTALLFLTELGNPAFSSSPVSMLANAWFHSVTLRTAGFNTIDHSQISPAGKLVGIAWMFVGASPGSTGGGVKTVALAIAVLTLRSVLRSQPEVTVFYRTITQKQINRVLAIIALGLTTVLLTTIALVVIEQRPELFLDHAYEATSAFATVGVSSVQTPTLKVESQLVLVVTMFLGRVGPVTLLLAIARGRKTVDYRYPVEKIAIG